MSTAYDEFLVPAVFRPYAEDPYEVAACNMYQELVGYLVYRCFGKQVNDPFLASMLKQFAKDEMDDDLVFVRAKVDGKDDDIEYTSILPTSPP